MKNGLSGRLSCEDRKRIIFTDDRVELQSSRT